MIAKYILKKLLGIYDYDREGERLIKKSTKLFKSGTKINRYRAIRIYNKLRHDYACAVWPGVYIDDSVYISHAHDIYIGTTASIGKKCKIYPGIKIIAAVKGDEERNEQHIKRHAKIGDGCVLGAGCTIIGPITVGDDVFIAAGAIVTKDIPAHSVVKNVNDIRTKTKEERF